MKKNSLNIIEISSPLYILIYSQVKYDTSKIEKLYVHADGGKWMAKFNKKNVVV